MSNVATKKSSPSTSFHLAAGLVSGFTSSILLQPADLLKTRVQQSGSSSLLATLKQIASQPHPIRHLWRGTLPSCIRTSIGSALYFTSLNSIRQNLAKKQPLAVQQSSSSNLPKLTPLANLGSGAFARASVGFVMMPITVIKVRYESSFYNYTSIMSAGRDIYAKEGLRGFFAGFGATALRDAPYAGLYVLFYEQSKVILSGLVTTAPSALPLFLGPSNTKEFPNSIPKLPSGSSSAPTMNASTSAGINFLSSTMAASLSTAVTNPPDAIKTRLQLQPARYRNTRYALKLMLKEEGIRSLFDGLALRMARKAMSSALAWTVYEDIIRRAEIRFADQT